MAAAAAASGPGFLARANAAALVGKAALAAPTLPRWMATPLSAAAVTTHTNAHANACLPSRSAFTASVSVSAAGQNRFAGSSLSLLSSTFVDILLFSFPFFFSWKQIVDKPRATTRRD